MPYIYGINTKAVKYYWILPEPLSVLPESGPSAEQVSSCCRDFDLADAVLATNNVMLGITLLE